MTTARDHLSKSDTVTIAEIEAAVPTLIEARGLIDRFHSMIRTNAVSDLEAWISDASTSLIASFAGGIIRDRAAIRAANTEPWSNGQTEGQTEGQITRPKLVKRQMYGRGKIRPPASQTDRCSMDAAIIEIASEPKLDFSSLRSESDANRPSAAI